MPPPTTWAEMSRLANPAISSGWRITIRDVGRGKYCSRVRLFTSMLPLPGRKRTRATAVLRRPVAGISSDLPFIASMSSSQRLRLLRSVRVLGPRVNLQLGDQPLAQPVGGQHALHG